MLTRHRFDVDEYTRMVEAGMLEDDRLVPVISTFFGIAIRMHYREHGVAHFHAEYQGQRATFTLDGRRLAGSIDSRTALRLIARWAIAHRVELLANWDRLKAGQPLVRIEPLH